VTAIPLRRIEGKYEILEKLGEGGMGTVYKVRHRLLDEIRVIKVMRPQLDQEEDLKARFFREARVAIQLRHPSIAQLYDFSLDEDDIAFIVMEFIEGITLESLLRQQGALPLGLALEISQQTLKALHYLHGKGFVHRDISPDNLMLTTGPDGEPLVKLIDLGIAKTLGGGAGGGYLTQTGTFLGKVRYAPPEQFGEAGASAMDARGDLYAFGIVLYELLTGRYPIRGRDPSSLIAGHLFWPPLDFAESDPDGRVPEALRALVLRALAKKPEERFANAQELVRALATLRTPADLDGLDLPALLRPPLPSPTGTAQIWVPPGSTPDRLDLQFGLRTTPSPSRVAEITRPFLSPPPPVAVPGPEVAGVVRRVEEKIASGDFKGAELMLYEAEVDFGSRADLTALHERLAEERRREMAAKAEARKRAEQIAAAVAEIESRLAQGQVDRAGEILDETMSSFGEDTVSGELRSRIRDLREEAREAERAALLEAARERFDMGDLSGALEATRQVETLAPGHAEARALRDEITAEQSRREEAEARRLAEEARIREEEEARRREEEARRLAEEARLRDEENRRLEEEARRREEESRREAAFTAHLETARGFIGTGDLDAAETELGPAESLCPGRVEIRILRSEIKAERRRRDEEARRLAEEARLREEEARRVEEEARRREEESRREAAFAAHLEAARGFIGTGDLEAAEAELDPAEGLVQGRAEARILRGEIASARRRRAREEARRLEEEARREAARTAAFAEIDARLDAGDLEAVTGLLARAVADYGGDPLLRARWERLEAAQAEQRLRAEEARRAAELAAALADIDGCLDSGRVEDAARLLPAAVALFGGTPALRERWERLEALWKAPPRKRPE
jgi:serine/threonine-protein kinase